MLLERRHVHEPERGGEAVRQDKADNCGKPEVQVDPDIQAPLGRECKLEAHELSDLRRDFKRRIR